MTLENQPLVSVVIPTYNRPDYLSDCVASILNSDYKNLEIIVVDNNPDKSAQKSIQSIIENVEKKIKFIATGKNLGASLGRKKGVENASGQWVLFVDDDNIIENNTIQRLIQTVLEDTKIAGISPLTFTFNNKKLWQGGMGANVNLATSQPLFFKENDIKDSFYKCDVIHNVYMINKKLGDSVGWFDDNIYMTYEEMDLQFKIKKLGYVFGIEPRCKAFHKVIPTKDAFKIRLVNDPKKTFSMARNRSVIIKRYGSLLQLFLFATIFKHIFFLGYFFALIKVKDINSIKAHILGYISGYFYIFTNRFINFGY